MFDWEDLKGFIVPWLVRFILKAGAGVLLALGLNDADGTAATIKIATAVVSAVVGFVLSKVNFNKALNTPVPKG